MSAPDSLPNVPSSFRFVCACLFALLAGCRFTPGEFRHGAVALSVSVTSGAGPVGAAQLDIWLSPGGVPLITLDSITLLTDSAGAVLHVLRPAPVDTVFIVRVAASPPPGSGLSSQTDSVVARAWMQDPPPDTLRFSLVLK